MWRLALLGLCAACALKYARAERPLVLPGNPCRVLAGADEWQYPLREVKPTGVPGLPEDVAQCLTAGLSAERTSGPKLAELLVQRLRDVGYLDAQLDGGELAPGERYDFAPAVPDEVVELLSGPYLEAKVVLAQEQLSKRAGCQVPLVPGSPDRERRQVPVTAKPPVCNSRSRVGYGAGD